MPTYKDIKEIKRIYDCGGYFSHMSIPKKFLQIIFLMKIFLIGLK